VTNKLLFKNDQRGEYPASWYAATADPLEPQPSLQESVNCDVCIIGAGFTGLSAALSLAERGIDVVLLDAHRIGWGASGRNGGQLGSGQRVDQDDLEKQYGVATAHALWGLAQASKRCVHQLLEKHHIDCDFVPGIIAADHKPSFSSHTQAYVEKLNKEYHYDEVSFIDRQELKQRLASDLYYSAAVDTGAGHLHPLKLAIGLARAAKASGARIFEKTEVLKYKRTDQQVKIITASGEITARVMPINNYIVASQVLEPDLAKSLIRDNMAVADSKFVVNYFRMSSDNRLLFGGRESYGYQFPTDIKSFVRVAMLKVFPQLEDVGIDYGWGGTLAITMNRMPHLTHVANNVLSSSGYSGHGVAMATLSGKLCAQALTGKLDDFDVMAGVKHQSFPGGAMLRSPLLKLGMLYYSLRDRL